MRQKNEIINRLKSSIYFLLRRKQKMAKNVLRFHFFRISLAKSDIKVKKLLEK